MKQLFPVKAACYFPWLRESCKPLKRFRREIRQLMVSLYAATFLRLALTGGSTIKPRYGYVSCVISARWSRCVTSALLVRVFHCPERFRFYAHPRAHALKPRNNSTRQMQLTNSSWNFFLRRDFILTRGDCFQRPSIIYWLHSYFPLYSLVKSFLFKFVEEIFEL